MVDFKTESVEMVSFGIAAGLLASSAGGEWWKAALVGVFVYVGMLANRAKHDGRASS
jgi:hypothetical protein